jgi:aminoglycoside 2'-N-acetyltransferase I
MLVLTCVATSALTAAQRLEVLALCASAYEEDLSAYLLQMGEGLHVLGTVGAELVTHAMVVDRTLEARTSDGSTPVPLRTAYIELVATLPSAQRRGFASQLLRALPPSLGAFDIAALSPSEAAFYERLGWELWRGPLFERTVHGEVASPPDEQVMVLRLPRTPVGLDLNSPISVEWREGEVW